MKGKVTQALLQRIVSIRDAEEPGSYMYDRMDTTYGALKLLREADLRAEMRGKPDKHGWVKTYERFPDENVLLEVLRNGVVSEETYSDGSWWGEGGHIYGSHLDFTVITPEKWRLKN